MGHAVNITLFPEVIALGKSALLKHQEDTVDALKKAPIVTNCAMTGAGKTMAAHLGVQSEAKERDVLFVAPTNALVGQHLADAKRFVREKQLPHKVAAVDGNTLYRLQQIHSSIYRPSAILHELIYNPRAFATELGIDDKQGPLWLITNPDQIWLSIVRGRAHDTRNLLRDFINHFRFVVVDEFHYYTAEQLTLFFLCIALWKHFGQFDDGLKMLLLTATPDEMVQGFIDRMGMESITVHSNRGGARMIPVLSPVELTLTTGSIMDFKTLVVENYRNGKDGVIISDSLFDINKAYKEYERCSMSVGRITGPINNKRRKSESEKRLILATPTVDLGFNFTKPAYKERQEIDFILSTARTRTAFWQRLGRAGRVLGKKDTKTPSQATMLLPFSESYKLLRGFNGKCLSRAELNNFLTLRDKILMSNALTREGLFTATKQLKQIQSMLPDPKKHIASDIFGTLQDCIDPNHLTSGWRCYSKRHWLSKQIEAVGSRYQDLAPAHIRTFLKSVQRENGDNNSDSMMVLLGSWCKNHFYQKGNLREYEEYIKDHSRISLIVPLLKKRPSLYREIINYYREQRLRLKYLFDFRGSGTDERLWVYDPDNLYSAHLVNTIDIVALLTKYVFDGPIPRSTAKREWKVRLPKGDFFYRLAEFHDYPYKPVFKYYDELPEKLPASQDKEDDDVDILPRYWQTVALHGLSLEFENKKIGALPIPWEIKRKLSGLSEFFFITPINNSHVLSNWLKEYDLRIGTLKARTKNGTFEPHSVVIGKDALLISEELYFKSRHGQC